jgi:hypothetical protein
VGIINVWTLFKVEKSELWQNVADVHKNRLSDSNHSNETKDFQMLTVKENLFDTLVSQLPAPV